MQLQQLKLGMRALESELDQQSEGFSSHLAHYTEELDRRAAALSAAESERATLAQALEDAQAARCDLERQVGELRGQASPLAKIAHVAQGQHRSALEEIDALRDAVTASEERLALQDDELASLRAEKDNLASELLIVQQQKESAEDQLARTEAALTEARARLQDVAPRTQQVDRLLTQTNERVFALETEKEALLRRVETLEGARSQLQGELQASERERTRLELEAERAAELQLTLRGDLAAAQSSIVRLQREMMAREDRTFELEDYRRSLAAAEHARGQIERQLSKLEKNKQEVDRALLQEKSKAAALQLALEDAERSMHLAAETSKRQAAASEASVKDIQRSLQRAEAARTDALQMLELERRRSQQMELTLSNAESKAKQALERNAALDAALMAAQKQEAEMQALKSQLSAKELLGAELGQRTAELEAELARVRLKLREASGARRSAADAEEVASLESERDELSAQLVAMRVERSLFQSRTSELEQAAAQAASEREYLKTRIAELEAKGVADRDRLLAQISTLQTKSEQKSEDRDRLAARIAELESKNASDREGHVKQIVDIEARHKKERSALTTRIAELEAKGRAAREEFEAQVAQLEKRSQELAREVAAAAAAAAATAALSAAPEPPSQDVDELRAENQTLLTICDQLKEQFLHSEESRRRVEEAAAHLEGENRTLEDNYAVLKGRLEQVIDRNVALQAALDEKLEEKGGKATEAVAEARTEALAAQRLLSAMEEDLAATKASEHSLKSALELEQATSEELGREVEQTRARMETLEARCRAAEAAGAPEAAAEKAQLEAQLARMTTDHEKTVKQMEATILEEKALLAKSEARCRALQIEAAGARRECERLRSAQAALEGRLDSVSASKATGLGELQRELAVAREDVAALTEARTQLGEAVRKAQEDAETARRQRDVAEVEAAELATRLEGLERSARAPVSHVVPTPSVREVDGVPSAALLMGGASQRSLRSLGGAVTTPPRLSIHAELESQAEVATRLAAERASLAAERDQLASDLAAARQALQESLGHARDVEDRLALVEGQLASSVVADATTAEDVAELHGCLEAANARAAESEERAQELANRVRLYEEAAKVAEMAAEDASNPQASLRAALEIQVQLQDRITGLEWALDRMKAARQVVPEQTLLQIQLLQSEIVRLQEMNASLETEMRSLIARPTADRPVSRSNSLTRTSDNGLSSGAPVSSAAQRLRRISSKLKEGFEALGTKISRDPAAEASPPLPSNVPIAELHRARDLTGSLLKDKLLLEQCVKYLVSSHPNRDHLRAATLPVSPGSTFASTQDAIVARILARVGQVMGAPAHRQTTTARSSSSSLSMATSVATAPAAMTTVMGPLDRSPVPKSQFHTRAGNGLNWAATASPGSHRDDLDETTEESRVPDPPFITPPVSSATAMQTRGKAAEFSATAQQAAMSPSTPIGNFRSLSLSPDKPETGGKRSVLSPEKPVDQTMTDVSLSSPANVTLTPGRRSPLTPGSGAASAVGRVNTKEGLRGASRRKMG